MDDNIYERRYKEPDFAPIHPNTFFGKNVRLGHFVVIEENCEIGDNCFIGNFCMLRPGTKIGNKTMIGHGCVFEGDTTVGNGVTIEPQCHITKGAVIEDLVFIGVGVIAINTRDIVHGRPFPLELRAPHIGRASRIASGSIIMPGVIVGENVLVGAGAVVTKNVPAGMIVIGVPARIVGRVPERELL